MEKSRGTGFDPAAIFRKLTEHQIDFVVIGGIAVQTHGHMRGTFDVDIVVALKPDNFERLAAALAEINAQLRGVDAHLLGIELDAYTLANGANFTLTTDFGDFDIFTDNLPGADDYEKVRERAVMADIFGAPVAVVGLEDLIAMKRAAGRARDLEDIAVLTDSDLEENR